MHQIRQGIALPPELVEQWWAQANQQVDPDDPQLFYEFVAHSAARWGADQELTLSCAELRALFCGDLIADHLQDVRRPRPRSLASQAIDDLDQIQTHDTEGRTVADLSTIRAALQHLARLEAQQ
jgi:hypothetical protein